MNIKKIVISIALGMGVIHVQAYELVDFLDNLNRQACKTLLEPLLVDDKQVKKPDEENSDTWTWGKKETVVSKDKNDQSSSNNNKVYFKDIVGIEVVLTEVTEIVNYLKNAEQYRRLGARMPCGILLEGPPGCGKTMIAKAMATEANCHFEQVSAASFIEEYVGVGAKRVRELFAKARAHKPAIIFIDEFDAVAGVNRAKLTGGGGDQELKQTMNQLLTELDGFSTDSSIIVIAATNNAASLDPAVKRSGRFDRLVHVPLPDEDARKKLLCHYLKKLPCLGDDITEAMQDQIVKDSSGLCAADFKNMVNEMAIAAVREQSDKVCARHVKAGAEKVIKQRNERMGNGFKDLWKK